LIFSDYVFLILYKKITASEFLKATVTNISADHWKILHRISRSDGGSVHRGQWTVDLRLARDARSREGCDPQP
jgi:hypothetical protein